MPKAVLVADDQNNVRNILEFNLKRRGYDVISAGDGISTLNSIATSSPDLVLLDIMMPGLDGYQILERMRSNDRMKRIPVLVISAKGTETDIIKALQLGARDYVVKPFNLDSLFQKISKIMAESERSERDARESALDEEENCETNYPSRAVISVRGKPLDRDEDLEKTIHLLSRAGAERIILDLSNVSEVGTIVFANLARIKQELRGSTALHLILPREEFRKTLDESNLAKHFTIHESWETAEAALR